jgi:hypothetical protein
MTGRFVWQPPTGMEHGRLSQVQRALSVLGLLEALTSIATEEDQAANSQPPYRSCYRRAARLFREIFQRRRRRRANRPKRLV